jgi:DHA2 family multidrug resistance protein
MLARKQQAFVNIYGANVDPYSHNARALFEQFRAGFMAAGADITTATERAYAAMYGMVQQQAAMASFVQLFRLLGIIFLVLLPLILLMRRPRTGAGPGAGAH